MILFVDALLFSIAAVLALIAATRGRVVLRDSAREGVLDFFKLMPRIMLGVIGAGYIAALLPQEVVGRWLEQTPASPESRSPCWAGSDAGRAGDRILDRDGCAEGRRGRPAGHRLHHRLGLVRDPAPVHLGAWGDAHKLVWLRIAASWPLPILAALGAMLLGTADTPLRTAETALTSDINPDIHHSPPAHFWWSKRPRIVAFLRLWKSGRCSPGRGRWKSLPTLPFLMATDLRSQFLTLIRCSTARSSGLATVLSVVASQVAKTGDMKIVTPTATMGIRGTSFTIEVQVVIGETNSTTGSANAP